jgi:XTP/dITP diphosphohydrolase
MRLVLASHNAAKLAEMRGLLAGLEVELVAQAELAIAEAEEPYASFIENALAKARHAAAAAGTAALADDSGLCVDVLGGAPGVISAHYAGQVRAATADREALRRLQDAANNEKLLRELLGQSERRAHFVCTLVAVRGADDPQPLVATGRWPGTIAGQPRGAGGFGYDPLMFIPGFGCTAAELEPGQKQGHSHRARAMAQLRQQLHEVWRL